MVFYTATVTPLVCPFVCRNGSFCLSNIVVCCQHCNDCKGNTSSDEFHGLLALTKHWHPVARRQLFARLRAGGRIIKRRN